MPRARKTPAVVAPFNTGHPAQAPAAPTGLPYGQHQGEIDAQRAIPLPNANTNQNPVTPVPGPPPPQAPGAPSAAGPAGAAASAPAAPAAAPNPLAAAAMMAPPNPAMTLTAPTQRPGEHVTTGVNPALPVAPTIGSPQQPTGPDPLATLQAIYQVAPNADVADLIQHLSR